jgi:mono/diheme cytochrome c family protein
MLKEVVHAPILQGECLACHTIDGQNEFLVNPDALYPEPVC